MSDPSNQQPSRPLDLNRHFWQILVSLSLEPAFQWLPGILASGNRRPNASRPAPHDPSPPQDDPTVLKNACLEAVGPSPSRARARSSTGNHHSFRPHPFGPSPLEALRLVERSGHPRLWEAYSVGLNLFIDFREEAGFPSAWPIPGDQMRGFITSMDLQDLSSPKIFMYTAALSYISRVFHFQNPLEDFLTSRMLVALQWRRIPKVPLTAGLLRSVMRVFGMVCTDRYEYLLFRSVFTVSFIAALRPEEIVVDGYDTPPPEELLCLHDFEIHPDTIGIHLRVETGAQSLKLVLSRSGDPLLCCIQALHDYLTVRPREDGPLFVYNDGQPLTRQRFLEVFHSSLRLVGISPHQYGIKSFRLGSLMSVVKYRCPERVIYSLARWPSKAVPERRDSQQ